MHHSIFATHNPIKQTPKKRTDHLLFQEPYKIQNNKVRIPIRNKISTHGVSSPRVAIVHTKKKIDTLLMKQRSDRDRVVLEVTMDNAKIILASMYLDIKQHIGDYLL